MSIIKIYLFTTTPPSFGRVLKRGKIHNSNCSVKIIFSFVDLNYPRTTKYLNSEISVSTSKNNEENEKNMTSLKIRSLLCKKGIFSD
jgi:hypothetical protein